MVISVSFLFLFLAHAKEDRPLYIPRIYWVYIIISAVGSTFSIRADTNYTTYAHPVCTAGDEW